MNNTHWIGAHVESYNFLKNSDLVNCSDSFVYKGVNYKVGDFVIVKGEESRIGKLISVFYSYDKRDVLKPHRGILQWYILAKEINQDIDGSYLKLNEDHEVVETSEITNTSISLQDIQKKCEVIFATVDDPIFEAGRAKFKFDIYSCRYKIDGDFIVPLHPYKSFNVEDLSESDFDNSSRVVSNPSSPLKRKPDCTPTVIDSDEYERSPDENKCKSIIIPLKNLKLTPNEKSTDLNDSYTKNNSVKRVLADSFDEISAVSYSIVNTNYENESIKLKFKLNDVKVHPTILTDEVVTMKSPIKLRHIQNVNNKIEVSDNGLKELQMEEYVDSSKRCRTPVQTPARISVRRSTRTTEKKSYKEFYSSLTDFNSISTDVSSLTTSRTTERSKRVTRTPKRYECGVNIYNLTRSTNTDPKNRYVSPKVISVKKTITFDNISDNKTVNAPPRRKSLRTMTRTVSYDENSHDEYDKIATTPKKKTNNHYTIEHMVSDDEEEEEKPKTNTRNLRLTLKKTPSKKSKDAEPEDVEMKTPRHLRNVITSTPKSKDTPSVRAKLVREGLITPSVQCRQKAILKDNTPLSKARNQLHVSYVPQGLPCREQQFLDIANFLKGKLLDGCGGCMYVSGVPGTGKTATVTDVVNNLQELSENCKIPSFKYVNINGMRLSEPRQAYVEIARQLMGKTMRWEQAQTTLENKFVKTKKKSSPIIMVIDELDILCTKRQDVVYNLLDWPTKANAQLIVVTIANTMDLPERLLMGRITSRLGLTRLTFQPYTHKQLQEIVAKRLMGTDAFNPDAIQLVARKVASVSGDARRALDICRRAAEIAELEGKYTLVSMNHVNEALNSMITQPKIQAIKQCSRLEKFILQAVVAEVERTGVEETNFTNVFTMLSTIAAVEGFEMASRTVLIATISRLGASRLLLTDQKCNNIHQRIILNVSSDDIYYALLQTNV